MTPEFRVNTYTNLWQQHPDIARLTDGSFVIVWDSYFSEDIGDVYFIAAQRFAADGTPIGGEEILSDVSLEARYPRVSALPDGGYAVSWQASPGSIANPTDVFTATYDADGEARGPILQVNPATLGDVFAAETIATSEGYLVIYTADQDDARDNELWLRPYHFDGTPAGGRVKVNAFKDEDDFNARAEVLDNGDIIVIWDSENLFNPDGIAGRVFRPDGTPRGPEFRITEDSNSANGALNLTNTNLSVAGLDRDRFVVTHNRIDSIDGITFRVVLGQIFEADGTPVGPEFIVDFDPDSEQEHTTVAALPGGGFVVAWDVWTKTDTSLHFRDVYAQVFNEWGQPVGDQIVVPTNLVDTQDWPSVVGLSGGRFVITYQSNSIDGDDEGIAARIFDVPSGNFAGLELFGTQDADDLNGDYGRDMIKGRGGRDDITGRGGRDDLYGGDGADDIDGGSGRDDLSGGKGRDRMKGGNHDDLLEGGSEGDFIFGGAGKDRMEGEGGADEIKGGGGRDVIFGGGAADKIYGGGGQDSLNGGGGADRFVFTDHKETGRTRAEADVIRDFKRSQDDLLDLRGIDARSGGGNQTFSFIGERSFSDTKGELRIRDTGPDVLVQGDRNGDGRADFAILVRGIGNLTADDFLL